MSNGISDGYRQLNADEVAAFDAYAQTAWQDESLPWKQYFRVVSNELEVWRRGDDVRPYSVALECMEELKLTNPTVLDVGASSAYYGEILNSRGYSCRYTALDYSESFKRVAKALYPDVAFDVGDARALPYQDEAFDVVLHGSAILHILQYEKAIQEAARVARRYVLFHRTAVDVKNPTSFHYKEAYDRPVLEIRFSHDELLRIFRRSGLKYVTEKDLFMTESGYGHRTYVLAKQ